MEYFSDKIHISLLKNYLINDPIIDYFNLQSKNYEKDKFSYYKNYIIKESDHYKYNFLNKIIELSQLDISLKNSVNETIQKIKKNIPLIIGCNLYNEKNNMFISCDMIIKY